VKFVVAFELAERVKCRRVVFTKLCGYYLASYDCDARGIVCVLRLTVVQLQLSIFDYISTVIACLRRPCVTAELLVRITSASSP